MSLFTERNGIRKELEKTKVITAEIYSLLFDCCKKYYRNIAWKYPKKCPYTNKCCGLDSETFNSYMRFEVPNLYRGVFDTIDKPDLSMSEVEDYDQYALLDFIEYIYANCKDILTYEWHSQHKHNHIMFSDSKESAEAFREEINCIFAKTRLLYNFTSKGEIERVIENNVLSESIQQNVEQIKEDGLQELINEAIEKHKSPYPQENKEAVEKIWGAFERMKTYYTNLDKKASATKIVNDISGGNASFVELFNAEFKALTDIGNNYRIRHHETDKVDITDLRHYDYFFNRCLSLIALSMQYLQ